MTFRHAGMRAALVRRRSGPLSIVFDRRWPIESCLFILHPRDSVNSIHTMFSTCPDASLPSAYHTDLTLQQKKKRADPSTSWTDSEPFLASTFRSESMLRAAHTVTTGVTPSFPAHLTPNAGTHFESAVKAISKTGASTSSTVGSASNTIMNAQRHVMVGNEPSLAIFSWWKDTLVHQVSCRSSIAPFLNGLAA